MKQRKLANTNKTPKQLKHTKWTTTLLVHIIHHFWKEMFISHHLMHPFITNA